MDAELNTLRIDHAPKHRVARGRRLPRWVFAAVITVGAIGLALAALSILMAPVKVRVYHVKPASAPQSGSGRTVILEATGYIIPAHRIEVTPEVPGRVAWVGVEMGDKVKRGQALIRLEPEESLAQFLQAQGNLNNLKAKLAELIHGSRPEEIARAKADLDSARADLVDDETSLKRTRILAAEGILARQVLDDAQAKYGVQYAKMVSLERTYDLERLGPRAEESESMRAQVEQAEGALKYAQSQLDSTVIRAPAAGTILDRNVEIGEYLTQGLVGNRAGDRAAKGYVIALADLRDLQVELDIDQSIFAKLNPKQSAMITIDAYPDRRYQGQIVAISPQADRQKASVQVKVQIESPDQFLRPDMNATASFYEEAIGPDSSQPSLPQFVIPPSAVRDHPIFVVINARVARRTVTVAGTLPSGVKVSAGLSGGEDVILKPPDGLREGQRVQVE